MLGLTGQDFESTLPFPGLPQLVGSPQKISMLKPGLLGFLQLTHAHLFHLYEDPVRSTRGCSPTSSGSPPLCNDITLPCLFFTPEFLLLPRHSARARIWFISRTAPSVLGTRSRRSGHHSVSFSLPSYAVERKIEPFYKGGKAQVTTSWGSWDRRVGGTE